MEDGEVGGGLGEHLAGGRIGVAVSAKIWLRSAEQVEAVIEFYLIM